MVLTSGGKVCALRWLLWLGRFRLCINVIVQKNKNIVICNRKTVGPPKSSIMECG